MFVLVENIFTFKFYNLKNENENFDINFLIKTWNNNNTKFNNSLIKGSPLRRIWSRRVILCLVFDKYAMEHLEVIAYGV